MLIACNECHRQYDVGDLATGSRVRCHCGHVCEVPEERTRPIQLLHCSSCGGAVSDPTSQACAYCQSELSLGERGLGSTCPECFARLRKNASFCSTCGIQVAAERVANAITATHCPRCSGQLVLRESPATLFAECVGCGGVWLDEQTFAETLKTRHASATAQEVSRRAVEREALPREPKEDVRYLPCVTCGQLMNRKNFAGSSGIVIDWCKGHGYWFDTDELTRIIDFIEERAHHGSLDGPVAAPHAEPRPRHVPSSTVTTMPPRQDPNFDVDVGWGFGDVLIDVLGDLVRRFLR